jgi:hypothetical protein
MKIDTMRVERNEEIAWSELDDEIVLLDIEAGSYYSLNEVSVFIWKVADGTLTVEQIVERVITEYDVERKQARDDVLRLLGELSQKNLLHIFP